MKKPPKNQIVLGFWPTVMDSHWFRAKWTGKRWMRFNELFGGWDPVSPPEQWKPKEINE